MLRSESESVISLPRAAARPSQTTLKKIALVGSFPPRCCGIATFTSDLSAAIAGVRPSLERSIVAIDDRPQGHAYDACVALRIGQHNIEDYLAAAARLNRAGVDAVCVQHEFGIYGGEAGAHVLALYRALRCPIVTTLHTVLERPSPDQRQVMEEIIELSARLVVMTKKGQDLLMRIYGAPAARISIIPHGAPDRPLEISTQRRWPGREVLLTFGLLSPNKGIESVIRAMPDIVAARPDAHYVVLGATHPHLVEREGERYRHALQQLAESLGVARHVEFIDRFVDTDTLLDYLAAADVYVTPYLHEAQITSGTLAYALALGKPVISTPYWHAAEALADGAGVLVGFGDSAQIARAAIRLFEDANHRSALAKRAYQRARPSVWSMVGGRYVEVMEQALEQRAPRRKPAPPPAPSLSLQALERMTDSCGMLQHGRFAIADRAHGYCLDDNARALLLAHRLTKRAPNAAAERLAPTYAAFIEHAWNPAIGRFRNFMSYDRAWLEQEGSQDSFGRALWAIGEVAAGARDRELRDWARHLIQRVLPHVEAAAQSPHAQAFSALGLVPLVRAGDAAAAVLLRQLGERLLERFERERRPDWDWFTPVLAYDNARLPEALMRAGSELEATEMSRAGLDALKWLMSLQSGDTGAFRPVGSESFGAEYAPPKPFDQQPIEACASVEACWAAFELTGDPRWSFEAQRAFAWFFGANDLGVAIARPESGGCYDGLCRTGPNRNQGAESILSYLLAAAAMNGRAANLEKALG